MLILLYREYLAKRERRTVLLDLLREVGKKGMKNESNVRIEVFYATLSIEAESVTDSVFEVLNVRC